MMYGYARVSTTEQSTLMQVAALRRAGCKRIVQEKQSAVKHRPELDALLARLRAGDELVVYKLDRLARSLSHLLSILEALSRVGAGLRSLTEPIDTTTPAGRMMIQILGAVAEFERSLIRERALTGLAARVRAGGTPGGRPMKLSEAERAEAKRRYEAGGVTLIELSRHYGVCLATMHAYIRTPIKREKMPVLRTYL